MGSTGENSFGLYFDADSAENEDNYNLAANFQTAHDNASAELAPTLDRLDQFSSPSIPYAKFTYRRGPAHAFLDTSFLDPQLPIERYEFDSGDAYVPRGTLQPYSVTLRTSQLGPSGYADHHTGPSSSSLQIPRDASSITSYTPDVRPQDRRQRNHLAPQSLGPAHADQTSVRSAPVARTRSRRYRRRASETPYSTVSRTLSRVQDDAEEEHAVESFPCPSDDCDVVLSTKECLRRHLRDASKHTSENPIDKPHICTSVGCNKRFRLGKDLRRHSFTHNRSSLGCQFPGCHQFVNARKDNLRRHIRAMHGVEDDDEVERYVPHRGQDQEPFEYSFVSEPSGAQYYGLGSQFGPSSQ